MKHFITGFLLSNRQIRLSALNNQFFNKKNSNLTNILIYQNKNQFHTTPNRNAINPLLWVLIKPVSKFAAIIVGRGTRKWLKDVLKREIILNHLKVNKLRYMFGLTGSGAGATYYYLSHLQTTPITNRKRFILFTSNDLKDLEDIGKEGIVSDFKEKILDIKSPYTKRALTVANRLFDANKDIEQVSNLKWKLTVVDAKVVNAMAFPSGEVIVFTGLLDFVENDHELAIIMAHEMSHAILQHSAEENSRKRLLDIASISLSLILWSIFPTDISALFGEFLSGKLIKYGFELPFSRDLEKEADEVGILLAAKACFDIRYSPILWRRMGESDKVEIPEIISTHPSNESRALDLEKLLPSALKIRKECKCSDLGELKITSKINKTK